MIVDHDIYDALEEEFNNFYRYMLKFNKIDKILEDNKTMCKGKEDMEFFYVLFLAGIVNMKGGVKKLHNILSRKITNKKLINKFIYDYIKLDYKSKNNMWSWNEVEEYGIEGDWDRPIKFTNYEL